MEKGLRANHNFGGKKSPIKDFEGILVGRRSSHIPLSEDDRAQLKALEEEIQMGKNKLVSLKGVPKLKVLITFVRLPSLIKLIKKFNSWYKRN